ncbi:thiamine pyrophosphate-binding protein [Actibacterium sp. 188UL27-1]|uniref:thiamine pyrophosphate-binding protein n=1 Tax=Actibacterium sp. 188UL27-1 TaxID=2786961 RepID=UPI00195CA14F|nr:thiamine pyrophosphate-binding protein [Actibacterium sp. 188UL27-1]MBM7069052.1 thiamine pyrophosphate-binding protein [Actibacterium sp. 188UL27-1]
MPLRHGGQILADQLALRAIKRVFSVPGESFLAALDGLYDSGIQVVTCRQEGGAAMMAEAHGKLTGQPGVLFVTRGPGASNASAGLHVAQHDGTPMVVFVGQIAAAHRDRGAFQEVNYSEFFGGFVKWVAEVDQTDRLPEYIDRAFRVAMSGRPGPVVLAVPEDMLSDSCDVPDRRPQPLPLSPDLGAFAEQALARLAGAKRPLVVVGGSHWSSEDAARLEVFGSRHALPIAVPFRRQDYIDNRAACYVGDLGVGMNPKLGQALRDADVVLALGTRLGDTATNGYSLMDPQDHGKILIHAHPDAAELGRVYATQLSAVASAPDALRALMAQPEKQHDDSWLRMLRSHYESWQTPQTTPGAVKMEQIIRVLSDTLPPDAIITNGAGNYAAFVHRYFRFKGYGTQVAPTSGSMGYGLPAAIAAKLENPEKTVVCMAGDGCFQMTLNELSTAMQHDASVIVIVVNNGRYGTIRMHQEKIYPGRVSGTDLVNPNFVDLIKSYGGDGCKVLKTEDFRGALQQATQSNKLSLIELVTDGEALSTGATLSEIRRAGEAREPA